MRRLLVGSLAALPMAGMGEAAFAVVEIREAMNAFRGYCWQAFLDPITDEGLWQKQLYRSPCGVVTLLPGETLWVPPPSACVHGEDVHDAGPFQTVWDHYFLVRLLDGKGGLHEACLYHRYYSGAPVSGTGTDTSAYFTFFDVPSGKEHTFKLLSTYYPDSDFMPYPLSFYWDGEDLHVAVSELGFDKCFERDPFPVDRCVKPLYCYNLRPFASRPIKEPLWGLFAEDTLRKEGAWAGHRGVPCVSPTEGRPSNWQDAGAYLSFSRLVDVPANHTGAPSIIYDANNPKRNKGQAFRLLCDNGSPMAYLIDTTLYDLRWVYQRHFERENYESCHILWDGSCLTFRTPLNMMLVTQNKFSGSVIDLSWQADSTGETTVISAEENAIYIDWPYDFTLRECEGTWVSLPPPPAQTDGLDGKPPALADILPAELGRRMVVKAREERFCVDYLFALEQHGITCWHYTILLDGMPRHLYVFPNRAYFIPGLTPVPRGCYR